MTRAGPAARSSVFSAVASEVAGLISERIQGRVCAVRGLTVKELRELCTKLPPRLLAELQITSNPDPQGGNGK